MRWERVHLQQQQQQQQLQQQQGQEETNGPGMRWGHTCNSIKGGRFLYVFGGYGKDNCQTNQVHVFDTVKQTWSQPVVKGTPPVPRDSHTCTTVGDRLFVFGGTDGMNPLRDLHIFDTSSHTWSTPIVRGEGPEAREGHSAALVGKRLFIFGGCGKSSITNEEIYFNDLYILNTETYVWKQAMTSGTPPSARDSHTCSSWQNKIIVIGGEDGQNYYLSDVHILDAETLIWKELSPAGQKLTPRAGHSTISLGKNLFVFGGFTDAQNLYDDLYMLDLDTGAWTKVMTAGDGPSGRFSVAGDCLDPLKVGVLVFIGGCNQSLEALDDMYYLYTGLTSMHEERKEEKLSMRKQLKLKCQEQNLNSPAHDKALVRIDTNVDFRHSIPSFALPGRESLQVNQVQLLQGKKTFQAKVTESFLQGYTIETIIDGKPLRGILFANKPNSPQIADHNNSRKRPGEEIGVMLNGDQNSKSKASRTVQHYATDNSQQASDPGKVSTLPESKMEAAIAPELKNPASSNVPQPLEVPMNAAPSGVLLNLNDDMTADTPNSNAGFLKENSPTAMASFSLSLSQDGRPTTAQGQHD